MPPAIAASMATSALYVDENKKVSQHKSELKNSIDYGCDMWELAY